MVSYGPWIQDPDFEQTVIWTWSLREAPLAAWGLDPAATRYAEHVIDAPDWVAIGDGTMMEITEAAAGNDATDRGDVIKPNDTRADRAYGPPAIGPGAMTFSAGWLSMGLTPWAIPAGFPANNTEGYIPLYWGPENYPVGAIDLEFEGDPDGISTVLGATLAAQTQFEGNNADNSEGGTVVQPLSAPFTTKIIADSLFKDFGAVPPDVLYTGSQVYLLEGDVSGTSRTLDEDLDISGNVTAQGVVLYTQTDQFMPPQEPSEFDGNERWEYGWWMTAVHLRWLLRPPRYRAIYDTEPPPAIRRTFPRDDGLAGGAPRNYPPSRAVQSGNRTSGGYL